MTQKLPRRRKKMAEDYLIKFVEILAYLSLFVKNILNIIHTSKSKK